MFAGKRRRLAAAAFVLLLAGGAFIPLEALAQGSHAGVTGPQLQAMIQVATTARAYASGTVALANQNGLRVASSVTLISQGDAYLATAQADSLNASAFDEGALAAQAAEGAYTSAAVAATQVLEASGLLRGVSADALAGAIVETNLTAGFILETATAACASIVVSPANSQALVQACAQASASVSDARLQLLDALTLVATFRLGGAGNATLVQAASAVSTARADLATASSAVQGLGALTYVPRAQAYVQSTLDPLAASATAIVASQQSAAANASALQADIYAFAGAQGRAVAAVTSNESALSEAISSVNATAAAASASASEASISIVKSNLSALLSLVSPLLLSSALVTSIHTATTSADAYSSSLAAASSDSLAFNSTGLSGLQAYVSAVSADRALVQSKSQSYLKAYQDVKGNLTAFLSLGGITPVTLSQILTIQSALNSMYASASSLAASANSTLLAEGSALSSVEVALTALSSALVDSATEVYVPVSLTDALVRLGATEAGRLNASSSSKLSQLGSSFNLTGMAAASFLTSVNSSLTTTTGGFATQAQTVAALAQAVLANATSLETVSASVSEAIQGDFSMRSSALALAHSNLSFALSEFSSGRVDSGIQAIVQAQAEFNVAAATSTA